MVDLTVKVEHRSLPAILYVKLWLVGHTGYIVQILLHSPENGWILLVIVGMETFNSAEQWIPFHLYHFQSVK